MNDRSAPRSIEQYLAALREALAGEDPALVQDALYDAEEYLRAEVAANPERSEGTYSRFASLDDRLDGDHYWFGWLKHGIGRCTSDAAQQIRAGDITREEGLALVARYDGEFPRKYWQERLDYLGLDDEQYFRIAERFCRRGLDWNAKVGERDGAIPRKDYARA